MRQFGAPSEKFVLDLIRSMTATRPFVACGERVLQGPNPFKVWEIDRSGRVPGRFQYRARVVALMALAFRSRSALLHVHFGQWAPAVARAARTIGRPWVVSLHGHDLLAEAAPMAQTPLVATAGRVIVPSRFLARAAVDFGFDTDRVRVIPSGVDLAGLPFRVREPDVDGAVVVTFIGRFVEKKGPIDAALALAEVQRRHPNVSARFVGFGPLETDIKRLIRDTGLRAEIVDGTDPTAVPNALASTHLVLTPSRTAASGDAETLCVVNLEAQASGIPVLTTNHGGIPEGVTAESAIVVPEASVASLVEGLTTLVEHPERWAAMGHAGRVNVERNFQLGARTAEVEAEYHALLASG